MRSKLLKAVLSFLMTLLVLNAGTLINNITGCKVLTGNVAYAETNIKIVSIATGNQFTLMTADDGTVKAWGGNNCGQLGVGNCVSYKTPQIIPNLTGVKQVVAGNDFAFALMNDGTVKSWGNNDHGQLGIGYLGQQSTPQTLPNLSGVKQLAVGYNFAFALMSDGTVKAWGDNYYGQLGIPNTSNYNTYYYTSPQTIAGLAGVKQIAAGVSSSYALMNDGTVKSWGGNANGELGTGGGSASNIPTTVIGLSGVKQISSGFQTAYALLNNGTVMSWGWNQYYQLGLGNTTTNYSTPQLIPNLTDVKQIAGGSGFATALKNDGTVYSCGYNTNGELGIGNSISVCFSPTKVSISGVSLIQTGGFSNHIFAVTSDGNIIGWGNNLAGEVVASGPYSAIFPTLSGFSYDKAPSFTVISPINNQGINSTFTPSISVSDPDNNTLTCTYFLDSEAAPRDTKVFSGTSNPQTTVFSTLVTSTISEGRHTLIFIVDDGILNSLRTVNIFVDRTTPVLQSINTSPECCNITVSGTAGDFVSGLDVTPYRYTIANEASPWLPVSASYTTKTPLIPSTKYIVIFEAKDTAGNIGTIKKDVYTKAMIPVLSSKTISDTSIELDTNESNSESTQYQISCGKMFVSSSGELTQTPSWITLTSKRITVKGLDENTQYIFQAKARNGGNVETDYSNIVSNSTFEDVPGIPSNIKIMPSEGKITVTWNPVENATGYDIEVNGEIIDNGTSTTYESNFDPGANHTFRVRAKNEAGTGEWSSVLEGAAKYGLPPAPTFSEPIIAGTSISISWNTVIGAIGYDLEIDGVVKNVESKTTYINTGLKPQTQHVYRVRARNIQGAGEWSSLNIFQTTSDKPGKPVISPVSNIINVSTEENDNSLKIVNSYCTNTSATINWAEVANAEYYQVGEVPLNCSVPVTDIDVSNILDNITGTTCEKRLLLPGSTHKYVVRGVNSMENGDWSDPITITTYLLDTPANISTDESDASITIKWDGVKDASSYIVSITNDNNQTTQVNCTDPIYMYSGLVPECRYIFNIKAVSSQGESGWSSGTSASTTPKKPSVPSNVSATISDTTIMITWDAVPEALVDVGKSPQEVHEINYDVELDGIVMEDDYTTTYIHEGLESDTYHTYRVRARNSAIEGDWSQPGIVRTLPGKPVIPKDIEVKSTSTSATLTWVGKDSDISYDIKIEGGKTQVDPIIISNITKNTYMHRRAELGQEYTYYIRTRNKEGVSDWSGKLINNAIKAKCTKNKTVDLGLTAKDVTDFSAYTMVVTYNASAVDVIDLSTLTGNYETTPGKIEGTDIEITDFTPGKITFKCDKVVDPGEAWTGVINSIKFKAKATGGTTITYTVLCKTDEIQ